MKHAEDFKKLFRLDPSSPTGLVKIRNGLPAGNKQRTTNNNTYVWSVRGNVLIDGKWKVIKWSLPNVIYELSTGKEVSPNEYITYKDGNKDNFSFDNLELLPAFSHEENKRLNNYAYDNCRNIILDPKNPDYYKDPKDWTHPESLKAIAIDKQARLNGENKPNQRGGGRKRKWN
ncbi:hypothetical protein EE88_21670 [Salmonella enterica]|nr:hypothetical protein [Salmonella enterica]